MQRVFLLWLMLIPGLNCKQRYQIWRWALEQQAFQCNLAFLKLCAFSDKKQMRIINWFQTGQWMPELQQICDLSVVMIIDSDYPENLKQISDPPLVLFYQGNRSLLQTQMIGVVGSREILPQTKSLLRTWLPEWAATTYTIVSGNAKGVDCLVHRIVLGCAGKTIAVIGTGLNHSYPAENCALQAHIGRHGLILSEYLPWVGLKAWHFPERNRIIVGLTKDIVICQAKRKSGTMVTATIANDENRNVWVMPGDVLNPAFAGNYALIYEGASVLTAPADLMQGT